MTKLCICIPTFNRLQFLKELISSIEPHLSPEVCVAISDNASTDGTEAYLQGLSRQYPQSVRININERNLGPDRNYQLAVAAADADYCWLMGSDDCVSPGAIPRALLYLERGADLVVSSRIDCSLTMSAMGQRSWFTGTGEAVYNIQSAKDRGRFFGNAKGVGAMFSYLSTTIIRKSCWDSVAYDGSLDGSAYSHAYILLKVLLDGARLLVVPDPLVMTRGGNDYFLQSGEAKRILLDIDGYVRIASMLSEYGSQAAILRLVRKEQPWWRIGKLGALLSTATQVEQASNSLKAAGYSSLTVMLMRACHRFPWPVVFAAFLKQCLKRTLKGQTLGGGHETVKV